MNSLVIRVRPCPNEYLFLEHFEIEFKVRGCNLELDSYLLAMAKSRAPTTSMDRHTIQAVVGNISM